MTFSIVARDRRSGALGIAVASRFFGVGALCPFIFTGAGALSTQALGHPPHGPAAGPLFARRLAPEAILEALLAGDPERERRQIHLVDASGRLAAFTGTGCTAWAGSQHGDGISLAGNMLKGPAVLAGALAAYESDPDRPFAERLVSALEAGQAAGGDTRGQQAAAILIHGSLDFPMVSLRVDDDPQAIATLRRLHDEAAVDYYPYVRRFFPAAENEAVIGP